MLLWAPWLPPPQVFNNSPDETAYFRMILNRESVLNSIIMIQVRSPSASLNPSCASLCSS